MGIKRELRRDLKTVRDARRMQLLLWREVMGDYDLELASDVWDEYKKLDTKYRKIYNEVKGK